MPSVPYNKFHQFVEDKAHKLHDLANDQITVALSNVAPVAANSVIADITEIDYTNLSARDVTRGSSGQTGGTYRLFLDDLPLTAAGPVATFQYVIVYNSTAPAGPLIAWGDYGGPVTMANGEVFNVNFDQTNGFHSET